MTVTDLRKALAALGPEYDESIVLVNATGIYKPGEATRLITIPTMSDVDHRSSWELFKNAVWIADGGPDVSRNAAEVEGWRVPYHNPVQTPHHPSTESPREAAERWEREHPGEEP